MTLSEQKAVAIDIETISPSLAPGQRPNFQNPRDFEIFSINVGTITDDGTVTPQVFFRTDSSPEGELSVIESAFEWCVTQQPDVVYSYNGESFDFVHLAGRPSLAAAQAGVEDTVTPVVEDFLRSTKSIDLKKPAWEQFGAYLKFEDAVFKSTGEAVPQTLWQEFDHEIDVAQERRAAGLDPSPPEVRNTDIPILGEQYLTYCDAQNTDCTAFTELEKMLTNYCNNDVIYQFELANSFS